MTEYTDTCHHCLGKQARQEWAEALTKNQYRQEAGMTGDLRSLENRYSVTGVAVDLTPGMIWVQANEAWRAVHYEEIPPELWKELATNNGRTMPGELFLSEDMYEELVQRTGSLSRHSPPEHTLCHLGIKHDSNPPSQLTVNAGWKQKRQPLDELTFKQAARVLNKTLNKTLKNSDNGLTTCECDQNVDN